MKVYRAETGQIVGLRETDLYTINSLDGLRRVLEKYTGVPAGAQILMTSFGTQVKQDMVKDVVQATGKEEYILIIYDRQYLDASHDEVLTLIEVEMPKLLPSPNAIDPVSALRSVRLKRSATKSHLSQHFDFYHMLFEDFDGYSEDVLKVIETHSSLANTIVAEQKAQSMALNVALTNLEAHVRVSNNKFKAFQAIANKEFSFQMTAIETVSTDLDVLRNTRIHDSLRNALPKELSVSSLADLVDESSILKTRATMTSSREILVAETQELASLIDDIQQGEQTLRRQSLSDFDLQALDTRLVEVRESCEKAEFLRDKVQRDFSRVHDKMQDIIPTSNQPTPFRSSSTSPPEALSFFSTPPLTLPSHAKKTLEAFDHLADIHVSDYLPKLVDYEQLVRRHLTELIKSKRRAMEGFLRQMNVISHLQSEIAAVSPRIETVDSELKSLRRQAGREGLQKPKHIILAYGALIIEIVRRKEYANILLENANVIADLFGRFRMQEQSRRDHYRTEYAKIIPFQLEAMDDTASYCEVSASNVRDRGPSLTRDDVNELLFFFKDYMNNDIRAAMSSPLGQMASRVQASYNQQGVQGNTSYVSRGSSPSMSRNPSQSRATESGHDKVLNSLMAMNDQMNSLRNEFLLAVERSYFQDQKVIAANGQSRRVSAPIYPTSRVSSPVIVNESDAVLVQKRKALDIADEKIKAYEARIRSLEEALQRSYKAGYPSSMGESVLLGRARSNDENANAQSASSTSSMYSIVDDHFTKKQIGELYMKLQQADRRNLELEKELQKHRSESSSLYSQRSDVSRSWEKEKIEWEKYKEYNEREKEELRLQIHDLELLLEEERQTFEENRKSLLKEAQIRDNLADIRIAGAEGDWKSKVEDLEVNLQKQQHETEKMRSKYEEEIRLLKESHARELASLQHDKALSEEQAKSAAHKASSKAASLETRVTELLENLEEEKASAKAEIQKMQEQMDNSEQARDEIKQRLAQARDMVAAAEHDWMDKNAALEKIVDEQTMLKGIVQNIITKLLGDEQADLDQETSFLELLQILDKYIDEKCAVIEELRSTFAELEANQKQAEVDLDNLSEKHSALRNLCAEMAIKLADIRFSVFGEITNQLQLSVDEDEASNLIRRLSFDSNIDSANAFAQWADTLYSLNSIDLSKFVSKVRKKVKDAHDLTRRWQKEYKDLKEKYNRSAAEAYEKIAFRNFKVGDVALFLPTRNSTGKPWAAFNINAPHYFLKPTDNIITQMTTREWIVARITSINESVVDSQVSSSNPYGLSEGFKFYQLEVENWRNSHHRKGHKSSSSKEKDKDGQANTSTKASSMQDSIVTHATQSQIEYNDMSVSKELSNGRRYTLPFINGGQDSGLAAIVDDSSPVTSPAIRTRHLSFDRQASVNSPAFRRPALHPLSSTNNSKQSYMPVPSSSATTPTISSLAESPKSNADETKTDEKLNTSSVDQSSLIWAAQE
ncbi:oligomeric [Umbelopsis nana]